MKIVKPNRATRTYTQHLVAEPAVVFPLLCPVREADWIDGWSPTFVISTSGLAEPDCVFATPAEPHNAIWYITRREPAAGFVEMIKITPNVTACRLTIQLRPAPSGSEAVITYSHTSLGPEGDAFVASFTEDYYRKFMHDWESRINRYLRHGSAPPATGNRDCGSGIKVGILCCAFLWILLWAAAHVQAQTPEFRVNQQQAVTQSEPHCTPNAQEQAVADLMRQDPRQQRALMRCDPILAKVARERAEDMGRRGYFSHINPEGFGPNHLVQQAGYLLPSFYMQSFPANNLETISAGYATPEATWNGWMKSTAHRTHLLGLDRFWAEQTDYGIGYAYVAGSLYSHYWVVITGRH